MGLVRPYIVSLVAIYGLTLPFLTKGFVEESNSGHYSYAYWGTLVATPLLPICCNAGFVPLRTLHRILCRAKGEPRGGIPRAVYFRHYTHHMYYGFRSQCSLAGCT